MGEDVRKQVDVIEREYARLGERPIVVELGLLDWFGAVGAIQLAMRARRLSARQVAALGKAAREMVAAIGYCSPELAEILELGFDWRRDV